ncbi:major facilitator superfamily transporter [Fusarium sp. NRRL 25303]|nr:major facilitator superfamily transporter [Fusarium sp. NRRL 25303]
MVDAKNTAASEIRKSHDPIAKDPTSPQISEISSREPAAKAPWWQFGKYTDEQRLVFKLDLFILSWACYGYFIRLLDTQNIVNAYVSGMKEDLGLYKDQYNWFGTLWTVGYTVGMIPSQTVLTYIPRPSFWLPGLEFLWAIITFGFAAVNNYKQIYAMRLVIGLLESPFYIGAMTLLGNWYTPNGTFRLTPIPNTHLNLLAAVLELASRTTIFYSASFAANMFSGYLQAAVYTGLDGAHGLAGWRWLFIMCGVISVPGALWGVFAVPDSPWNSKAFYLTEKERDLARTRMENLGRQPFKGAKLSTLKNVVLSPFVWIYIFNYVTFCVSTNGTAYFPIYLKSRPKYSVQQVNVIPSGAYAVGLVATICWGQLSDRLQNRPWIIFGISFVSMVSGIVLATSSTKGGIIAGYILNCTTYAYGPIAIAYISEVFTNLPDERAFVLGCAQAFGGAFNAWVPLVAFNVATQAPLFRAGWTTTAAASGAQMLGVLGLRYFGTKILRQAAGKHSGSSV